MIEGLGVAKLGIPAFQRVGSLAFQKVARLQRIDNALKGIEENDLAEKLLSDYKIVKGTWRGEYTKNVDVILNALQQNGIIQLIMAQALVGVRSAGAKDAVVHLMEHDFGDTGIDGNALYNEIAASFEISVKYLSKDPVSVQILHASHESLILTMNRLESGLQSLRDAIEARPSDAYYSEIVVKLLKASVAQFRNIKVETSQGPRDIEIKKIYISPRLRLRRSDNLRSLHAPIVDKVIKNHRKEQPLLRLDNLEETEERLVTFSLSEIKEFSRIVVLGDPGGGKSTLMQSLCFELATKSLKNFQDKGEDLGFSHRVPMRVILRDFERARVANSQLSIFDFIVNEALHGVTVDRSAMAYTLSYLLSSGKVLLAFDGLDEILKVGLRRQFVDLVMQFVTQYPLCPVIVTSRLVGYDRAPLPSGEFDELVLQDFPDDDVEEYAVRFIKNVGKRKIAEARMLSRRFMIQTGTNASDLRKNPLMLGLMMWIYNIRGDVPSNRPEIYKECSRLMFERWDTDRSILVDLPQTFDRLQIFSYIASRLFGDSDLAGGVSNEWIEKRSKEYLLSVLEDAPQASAAARALVDFIVGRSWVMSEKGEGIFSFTHQTFLEYFFAKYLDDEHDSVGQLFSALIPHVREDEWEVVSRLALQIKTNRNRRREDEAIDLLLAALVENRSHPQSLRSVFGFSIRALEFLIGSEAKVRALVDEIIESSLFLTKSGIPVDSALALLFSGARERRDFVFLAAREKINAIFVSGTDDDRLSLLTCVDGKMQAGKDGGSTPTCASFPDEYAEKIKSDLIPIVIPEAGERELSASKAFEWACVLKAATLKKFGLAPAQKARPGSRIVIDGLSALILAASGRYPGFFSGTGFGKVKAEAALRTIGKAVIAQKGRVSWPASSADPYLSNPPQDLWGSLLKDLRKDNDLRLGALACTLRNLPNIPDMLDRPNRGSLANAVLAIPVDFRKKGAMEHATAADRLLESVREDPSWQALIAQPSPKRVRSVRPHQQQQPSV